MKATKVEDSPKQANSPAATKVPKLLYRLILRSWEGATLA